MVLSNVCNRSAARFLVALSLAACDRSRIIAKENVMDHAQTNQFIVADLTEQGTDRWVRVRWTDAASVNLALHLELGSVSVDITRIWPVRGDQVAAAQQALGALLDEHVDTGVAYRLVLRRNAKEQRLSWVPASETPGQMHARTLLEEAAQVPCLRAIGHLDTGRRLIAAHDAARAAQTLREGIAALGDRYFDENSLDSTGMKLVLAEHKITAGKLDEAVVLLERVLESRVLLYVTAHGL
jgi:hypothetical protein